MAAVKRIAVVTGANRGIGFEVCRQLARRGDVKVVLTSRNEEKGKAAAEKLAAEGLAVEFHRVDVTDGETIGALASSLEATHGRCDVLVNNAGVMLDPRGSRALDAKPETFANTLEVNFLGPLRLAQALVPLMKRNGYGRIVNFASGLGQLADMGTGTPAYRVSKTALNALTRMLSAELNGSGILVNSMCPGWVRTDMGGAQAPRTVEQGADTAVWLATLPVDGPTGGFFRDRKPMTW
ncbi:MAG: SDR family oxidoreductase [Betaproteobacteria bacterium]|nr:SDR family oxidoreductase [Betaproteobacteria bacterium]